MTATALFGCFALVLAMDLDDLAAHHSWALPWRSVTVFLVLGGAAVTVAWLPDIVASWFTGPPTSLEVYHTEISYALDLGIVGPLIVVALVLLRRRTGLGLVLTAASLVACITVGLQTVAGSCCCARSTPRCRSCRWSRRSRSSWCSARGGSSSTGGSSAGRGEEPGAGRHARSVAVAGRTRARSVSGRQPPAPRRGAPTGRAPADPTGPHTRRRGRPRRRPSPPRASRSRHPPRGARRPSGWWPPTPAAGHAEEAIDTSAPGWTTRRAAENGTEDTYEVEIARVWFVAGS